MNVDRNTVLYAIAELAKIRTEHARMIEDMKIEPAAPERPAQLDRLCSGTDALVVQLMDEGIPPALVVFMVLEHMKAMVGSIQERAG